jgi:dCTP deaminase
VILTGPYIAREVRRGRITIEPFEKGCLNPNSYNYRLGSEIVEIEDEVLDPRRMPRLRRREIPTEGFVLQPGRLYLAYTREKIGSCFYVTSLIGRSTVGRLGLWLQITADLGHLGAEHNWTLELKVVQPLRVFAGMQIGQVTFWQTSGPRDLLYRGKYAHDVKAQASRILREFA